MKPERFTRAPMAASLIGSIGQALSPLSVGPFTHPGHASLRSLIGSCKEPLHACVGLAVESLAFGRTSICAAVIYGFIHRPRPVRTTPARIGGGVARSCCALHLVQTEFGALHPYTVQNDGDFACDSNGRASSSFGSRQPHAPRFQRRSSSGSDEQGICRCIER